MNRIILLVSLCAIIYNSGCSSKKKETEEASRFTATSPLQVDTSFTKEYVSQIQSIRNVELRAQEKGYLQAVNVDEGQYVHAGQLLFRIMPKIYEAELLKAKAVANGSELELQNTKTLTDKDVVSKTELLLAQAKLDEAKADLALAQAHLSFTEIRAPFDGVIDRIRFKQGSLIDEGTLLTTISDNKNVFAYFNVSESEYLNYKKRITNNPKNAESVSLLLANNEPHKYPGIIETVEGEFDNETGNIAFRAKFPNPDLLLKHGETGKVQRKVALSNALIIPQKATYELQDKVYVFVIGKDNVVKSRNITIKSRMPDVYVVDEGLSVGDKILLDGVQTVRDDDKITYKFIDPKEVFAGLQLIKQQK